MLLPRLKIRNIKSSLILENSLNISGIFPINSCIVTIYKNSRNLVNVTKLKSFSELYKICEILEKKFRAIIKTIRIDSIMLSRKCSNKRFSLKKMLEVCKRFQNELRLNFNVELFHAPWISSQFGSFNLFTTGSVTVLGVKKVEHISIIQNFLDKVYSFENEIIK